MSLTDRSIENMFPIEVKKDQEGFYCFSLSQCDYKFPSVKEAHMFITSKGFQPEFADFKSVDVSDEESIEFDETDIEDFYDKLNSISDLINKRLTSVNSSGISNDLKLQFFSSFIEIHNQLNDLKLVSVDITSDCFIYLQSLTEKFTFIQEQFDSAVVEQNILNIRNTIKLKSEKLSKDGKIGVLRKVPVFDLSEFLNKEKEAKFAESLSNEDDKVLSKIVDFYSQNSDNNLVKKIKNETSQISNKARENMEKGLGRFKNSDLTKDFSEILEETRKCNGQIPADEIVVENGNSLNKRIFNKNNELIKQINMPSNKEVILTEVSEKEFSTSDFDKAVDYVGSLGKESEEKLDSLFMKNSKEFHDKDDKERLKQLIEKIKSDPDLLIEKLNESYHGKSIEEFTVGDANKRIEKDKESLSKDREKFLKDRKELDSSLNLFNEQLQQEYSLVNHFLAKMKAIEALTPAEKLNDIKKQEIHSFINIFKKIIT